MGIRPQDILVLLLLSIEKRELEQKDVAKALKISPSGISYSYNRLRKIGLLTQSHKVMKKDFMDFLQYAVRYVFPAELGPQSRGIPTAVSAGLFSNIQTDLHYVWPSDFGKSIGQSVSPLYKTVPEIVHIEDKNTNLYICLALIDSLRVGKARERNEAMNKLRNLMM